MRQQWVALLSMLGLAGSGMPAGAQVLKGSVPPGKTTQNKQVKTAVGNNAAPNPNGKLTLNQQNLRKQNQGSMNGGKQADTMTPSAYCNAVTKGNQQITKGNQQITKGNQAVTKGNQAITKGNQAVTKGNQAITKGNQAVTKGNQAITKGNQAVTKGNQAVTKGNAAQTTAAVPR
jgi:hypothetical protein